MTEKYATGGFVRRGDGPAFPVERSCWTFVPKPKPPPEGTTLSMNFGFGFTAGLSAEMVATFRALTTGAPVDPRIDEEWDAWRCPGCGRSHADVGTGHAWQTDGAGNATCNGESA